MIFMEATTVLCEQKEKLGKLQALIDKLNASNKSTDKLETLKEATTTDLYFLKLTYDSFITFWVTSKAIKKHKNNPKENKLTSSIHNSIESLLEDLASRQVTGHEALERVLLYIEGCIEYEDLIYKIIDRDLRIGIGVWSINKIHPGLIPEYEVSTGYPFKEERFEKGKPYYCSHKLDGVRLSILIDETGKREYKSKTWKDYDHFAVLDESIASLWLKNVVLDGEACIMNGDKEDFDAIVSEIRRKDHTIENPKFKIFDYIPLEDFKAKRGNTPYTIRLAQLTQAIPNNTPHLEILPQTLITSEEELNELARRSLENGWEGLMLRQANSCYQGKRSWDLMKYKHFEDDDFMVTGIFTTTQRKLEDGIMQDQETLGWVIIDVDGVEVEVGTGFKREERDAYFNNPSLIVWKTITVRYQGKTKAGSLRIPSFKAIRNYD